MNFSVCVLLLLLASALPLKAEEPSVLWERAFGGNPQAVWEKLKKNDGKVTADEVIELQYTLGSHHDGDRQLYTVYSLAELPDDPIPHLKKMMKEKTAERRGFAVLVAGILGDQRLAPDIKALTQDNRKLGDVPGDWFWDTVADAAKESLDTNKTGGIISEWISINLSIAAWWQGPDKKEPEK